MVYFALFWCAKITVKWTYSEHILKHEKVQINHRTHQMNLKIESVCVLHSCFTCGCDHFTFDRTGANNRTFHSFCAQSADTVQIYNTNANYLLRLKICWKSLAAHDSPSTHHSQFWISILRKSSMCAHRAILVQSSLLSCSSPWFINIQLYLCSSCARGFCALDHTAQTA